MPNDQTLADDIAEHGTQSLDHAMRAERHPLWKRHCPELTDSDFIRQGLLRCISVVDSGRHFLQIAQEIHQEKIPVSSYFNALKSSRRADRLKAVQQQSDQLQCDTLCAHGIDYLSAFS